MSATPASVSSQNPAPDPSANSLFKSMVQGSGLYSIAIIGQRLVGMLLLPVLTRYLTPADYGVMELLDTAVAVLALLFGAHFHSALGYFYFQHQDPARRRSAVGTVATGAALTGTLGCIVCWPFSAQISRLVFGDESASFYFRLLFCTMPLSFLLETLFAWLRVENRTKAFVGWTFFRTALTAVTVVTIVGVFHLRVLGVLLSTVSTFVIVTLALATYCLLQVRPALDRRLFGAVLKFTIPVSIGGLAVFFINFGDRFFLRPHVPMAELGIYALAYKIGLLVNVAYSCFAAYWSAQVYGIMKREDAAGVFARVQTYLTLAITLVCLVLVVCSKPMLRIAVAPGYYRAAALIPIIVVAYGVRSLGDFFKFLLFVEGRPSGDAYSNWFGAAFCLAGYVVLIPRYGTRGAAFATLIAFGAVSGLTAVWSYRLRPYRLEGRRLLKIAAAVLVVTVPYVLAPVNSLLGQVVWAAFLIAVFLGSLLLLGFATPGEKGAAIAAFQHGRRFLARSRAQCA